MSGTLDEVAERYAEVGAAVLGRDRTRASARPSEVRLLPRQWQWLREQPAGADATLRRLLAQAMRDQDGAIRRRAILDSTYRFLAATAGNEVGFEEAIRALYAADMEALRSRISTWPADLVRFAMQQLAPIMSA